MKIYIELLLIFIPMIIFISWYLWNGWSRKRLLKKYKPENDKTDKLKNGKTRKGGEECREAERIDGREHIIKSAAKSSVGLKKLKRRKLFQTTKSVDDGKTSDSDREPIRSNRKNGRGIRKLLGRRRT